MHTFGMFTLAPSIIHLSIPHIMTDCCCRKWAEYRTPPYTCRAPALCHMAAAQMCFYDFFFSLNVIFKQKVCP